ncbi:MAG: radical SAM protein [Candidatus Aureabacteria bacterium]|nr:radical SAM protein [Candidatus Auribacterota bacterium]
MERALFIHASLNVRNVLDQRPLVLKQVTSSRTALEYLLFNAFKSSLIKAFYLVTSASPADDAIEDTARKFKRDDFHLIRFPSVSPYAIDEKNRLINTMFTFRNAHYGFYITEALLEFARSQHIDHATVIQADHNILLQADLLDAFISQTVHRGDFFSCGHPSVPLVAAPVEELKTLFMQVQAEKKRRLQHILRTIDDDAEFLQKEYGIESDRNAKKKKVENTFGKPSLVMELLSFRNARDGYMKKGLSELYPGKEMQFYPLLTESNLENLKKCLAAYEELSIDNFFEREGDFSSVSQKDYPGFLEVEITSRCDLACRSCPQTILDREKSDMSEEIFYRILDEFAGHVPMLCLSGFGEPLLHPKAHDFIRTAKGRGFHRVAIETNGMHLDADNLPRLMSSGLDILILNLDALDSRSGTENSHSVIKRLLEARGGSETPFIIIQMINNLQKKKKIDIAFRKWQYLVDRVLLLPFNDFLGAFQQEGVIDFTPPRENNSLCRKTTSSMLILSSGEITLCKQKFNGFGIKSASSYREAWQGFRLRGLKEEFCQNCSLWYQLDVPPFSELTSHQAALFEDKLYGILLPQSIEKGKSFYEKNAYEEALDEWEKVLRFDPSNEYIHKKLDELLEKLEKEEKA